MKRTKLKTMRLFIFIVLMLTFSCATKTWILEGQSQVLNHISISVKTDQWKYSPSDLEHYVLPIYIEVENHSKEVVSIRKEDVFLLDEKKNQFNPLEPSDVMSMVRRSYGFGFSFGIGYWSSPFGLWWYPYYTPPPVEDIYPDILNKAFTFGEVQPGAKLKGFVYFPKPSGDVKALTLYVKGYSFYLKVKQD